MLAITVVPGKQGSAGLSEMPEPPADDGPIVVDTQAVGICGTDMEIISGEYGTAPPGEERLITGHESLGRVAEAPAGSGFSPGDLVVGIVRRPDPVPCPACAAGDWDMCSNGRYTERGIMGRHGFAAQRYRIHPEYLVAVDPALGPLGVLLEPATVVAKAWDHIEKIGRRSSWHPRHVLIGQWLTERLDSLLSRQVPADTVWGVPLHVARPASLDARGHRAAGRVVPPSAVTCRPGAAARVPDRTGPVRPGMKIIYSGRQGHTRNRHAASWGPGMVRREVVIVEDDLDGGPAKETVRFGLDGADYEIDLNAKNARKFRKRLAPFVEHAHRVAAGRRRPARTAASRQRSRDIRAWARQRGIELSDRGRMPASIVDQYEASTGRTARRLPPPHPGPVRCRQDGRRLAACRKTTVCPQLYPQAARAWAVSCADR
jgi:Lsr2 protein/alcohol dehydrogenase-like protein